MNYAIIYTKCFSLSPFVQIAVRRFQMSARFSSRCERSLMPLSFQYENRMFSFSFSPLPFSLFFSCHFIPSRNSLPVVSVVKIKCGPLLTGVRILTPCFRLYRARKIFSLFKHGIAYQIAL